MSQAPAPRRPGRRRLGRLDWILLAVLAAGLGWLAWRVHGTLVYRWDWSVVGTFLLRLDPETGRLVPNILLDGLVMTLRLTVWAGLLAAVAGVLVGLATSIGGPFWRLVGRLYVETIRNLPPLVFIFIFYFFVSSQLMPLLDLRNTVEGMAPEAQAVLGWLFGPPRLLEPFVAGTLCLGLFEAAFVAEIVRAGIQAIPRGQWEAAESLGLPAVDRLRFVILPQAVQRTVPPLAGQFISLVKDSSIVSLISVPELTFAASQAVVSTRRVFELWLTVGAFYFVICFLLSLLAGRLERRLGQGRR